MTNETNILENESSHEMTVGNASTVYLVESFLSENYAFRRNLLSGKTEFAILNDKDDIEGFGRSGLEGFHKGMSEFHCSPS